MTCTITGVAFYRRCLAAGVAARLAITGGTTHCAEIFGAIVPDIAKAAAQTTADFARSL